MSSSDSYPRLLAQLELEGDPASRSGAYLEIEQQGGGAKTRKPLTTSRVMIGRAEGLELVLAGTTVSRYHAELQCDPRGLWWVQDMNSTNGTLVNGWPVASKMLKYGDTIGVGDYQLTLRGVGQGADLTTTVRPPDASSEPTPPDMKHVGLSVEHSLATNRFVASLQHIQNTERRRHMLCEYAASREFAANYAWVARLSSDGEVKLLAGRVPEDETEPGLPEAGLLAIHPEAEECLELCRGHLEKFISTTGPTLLEDEQGRRVVACTVSKDREHVEVFCVRLHRSFDSAEWQQLIAFLADGVQRSDELWRLREDNQRTSKLEYELSLANQIQTSLVPESARFQGLELSLSFTPSRSVGGDYVDFVRLKDGRILLVVADVCGKGLQAALVSISLHTLIHVLVNEVVHLKSLVRSINRHLSEFLPDHSFVTMMFIAIDTHSGRLECINAGHPPALMLNVDGTLRQLQSQQNVALGMIEFEPKAQRFTMAHDEILFMFTDGLSEAKTPQGTILGLDELETLVARLVRGAPDADLEMLRRRLEQSIKTFQGGTLVVDDCAFLLARLTATARGMPAGGTTVQPPPTTTRE